MPESTSNPWPAPSIVKLMETIAAQNRAARLAGPGNTGIDLRDQARDLELRIAAQIRAQRTSAGMSQADLAAELTNWGFDNMHQTTIAKIEKGDRPLRIGELFAIGFALDIPWLSLVTTGWSSRGMPDDDAQILSAPVAQMENYLERLEDGREASLTVLKNSIAELVELYAYEDARAYLVAASLRASALTPPHLYEP